MESIISKDIQVDKGKITTIKLTAKTKSRIDHLKLYSRETYEEIIKRVLEVLNIARNSPERARALLIKLDRERKRNIKG